MKYEKLYRRTTCSEKAQPLAAVVEGVVKRQRKVNSLRHAVQTQPI
jgi:hypothetical protein